MASGSFSASAQGYTLKTEWSSTLNIASNSSLITCNHYLICPYALYINSRTNTCTVNNESKSFTSSAISISSGATIHLGTTTYTVNHNSDGKKSVNASTTFNMQATISGTYVSSITASGPMALDNIPRYASVSQSLSAKTETTITMNWSSNSTVDGIWFSINSGSSWSYVYNPNNTGGSFTISGLSANTTYNIKTRVRRKDSQLTTDSSTLTVTTFNYPHCTNTPNFIIGNAFTLSFYNPLGRTIKVTGYSSSGGEIFSGTTNGTSMTGFNDADSINKQYNSIPNSLVGNYKVVVVYNTAYMTRDNGNTYTVNANLCIPAMGSISYSDTNSSVVAITGNNQHIVQNKSNLKVTYTSATAKNGASISKYTFTLNGVTKTSTSAGGTIDFGIINSANNLTLTISAIDSRGIVAQTTKTITMLSYSSPTFSVYLKRLNNYEDETYLKVDGSVSSVNSKNKIEVLQYRYKLSGGEYGDYVSIVDNTQYTLNLNKENIYIFEIIIKDSFGTITVGTQTLGKGVFPLFIDTVLNSVGINCFPKNTNSLEVNNLNIFNIANNFNRCVKTIYTTTTSGVSIKLNNFNGLDKIPIIIAGADNGSMTPVITVVHLRSGSGFGHTNLGYERTLTRDSNVLHINASQWSYYMVIAPMGCEIELSNSAL